MSISSKKCNNRGPVWITVHSSEHSKSNYSRFQEKHKVCIRLSVAPEKKMVRPEKSFICNFIKCTFQKRHRMVYTHLVDFHYSVDRKGEKAF